MSKRKEIETLIEEELSDKDNFEHEGFEDNVFLGRFKNTDKLNVEDSGSDFISRLNKTNRPFHADGILPKKTYGGRAVSRKLIQSENNTSSEGSEIDEHKFIGSKPLRSIKRKSTTKDEHDDGDSSNDSGDEGYSDVDLNENDSFLYNSDSDSDKEVSDDTESYSYDTSASDDSPNDSNIEEESDIENDVDDDTERSDFQHVKVVNSSASDDIEKGKAVHEQLRLWERLLEGRIKIQKCLLLANKLPKHKNFKDIASKCSTEDGENNLKRLQNTVAGVLNKLLYLQALTRKNCSEYISTIEEDPNEENETLEEIPKKKRKLNEYSNILEEHHKIYIPYRNSVIQKWNEKTKVSTGRAAKSNFSAFDEPVLKQIEHILTDKQRLIRRTQTKRSEYNIIGDVKETENKSEEKSEEKNDDYDPAIFDDDDFYHKLLRDYIERKTVDITDPTQLAKKWVELQKLRNKLKRKIDTRATKGRKLRYDVHPKLVNFMAPVEDTTWNETAVNELYNSIFGKILS